MKMKILFATVLFVLAIVSCKKTDTTDASVALQKNIPNVAYGDDPAQVMDVYLPSNRSESNTRVLIMIHGGGWTSGDKADLVSFVDTIQRRLPGYAIFNINYRLAGGGLNLFPTQENDVKTAVEFIYSKRSEYAISGKFALLGASAGAHLALLQSYKDTSPVKIKAVIDFFGPADMTAMYEDPALPGGDIAILNVVGTTPALNSLLYASSSPINYITTTSTPTLIFHGGMDVIVKHAQSDTLFARLDAANVAASFVTYPTQNHGWTNSDTLYNSFNYVQSFLTQQLP